jgi:rsbT co-antagonist protein RsbR
MLAVPLIGHVDEDRAAHLSERLLQAVSEQRARFVILDVTGVEALSNETARHLLQLLAAISLIGATGLLSGIRAALAKTMVPLDLQLSHVQTFATLKDALTHCLPKLTQTGWKGLA